jgi:hypothetical protein
MKTLHTALVAALFVATPSIAFAQLPSDRVTHKSPSKYPYERGGLAGIGLVTGLKLGAGFGQPFSEFGTSPVAELELGYLLPPLKRSFEIFLSGQYAQPVTKADGIEDDHGSAGTSRLPGPMSYEIKTQQAVLTLGALYRVPLDIPMFRPYAGIGGRMYLLKTTIDANAAGMDFGQNTETGQQFGFYGALGGELYLGPGALLLEVQFGQTTIDGFVLREANAGALNTAIGYRLFI